MTSGLNIIFSTFQNGDIAHNALANLTNQSNNVRREDLVVLLRGSELICAYMLAFVCCAIIRSQ